MRLWRWQHRWFRPLQKEELSVEVTTKGEVVGFEHLLPEDAAATDLAADEARRIAETFLAGAMARPLATLAFVEGSTQKPPHRTDHSFTWKVRHSDVRGADYRIAVDVAGGAVAGYREWLKVPDTWQRDYQRLRSKNETAGAVDSLLLLLTLLAMMVFFIARLRRGDVRWRAATILGGTALVLMTVSQLNSLPSDLYGYDTTASFGGFLVSKVLLAVAAGLGTGLLIFLLSASAEPMYRERFPPRLSLTALLRPRALGTREFFVNALVGITLTFFFFAFENVFYIVAHRLGAWSPREVAYSDLLSTAFPWVFVLFFGFLPAVSEEFISRMFSIPFFERIFRSSACGDPGRGVHLGLRPRRLPEPAVVDPRSRGGHRRHRLRRRLPALRHHLRAHLPLLGRRALHGDRAHPLAQPLLPDQREPVGGDLRAALHRRGNRLRPARRFPCRRANQCGRGSAATASKPKADAISSIWSKSSRWFTVTISPSSLNANWTIWVAGTFIAPASSETEMNSFTRMRVFSRSRSSAAGRPAPRGTTARRCGGPSGRAALHALEGLQDVGLHGILIHQRACPSCPSSGRRPSRRRARRCGAAGRRAAGASPPARAAARCC